jgi:hypothetical protein
MGLVFFALNSLPRSVYNTAVWDDLGHSFLKEQIMIGLILGLVVILSSIFLISDIQLVRSVQLVRSNRT